MTKQRPCHQAKILLPGNDHWLSCGPPIYPVGRLRTRLYCKYCYNTHSDWHLMRKADYGTENTIVLCGRCEHTSMLMLIDNVNESKPALKIIRDEPACDCGPFGVIGFDPTTGTVHRL